jgi:CHAT domain-containing protein
VLAALPRDVKDLVIIPDGVLHQLPIDALRAADGRFLAERFRISTVGSAALLLRLRTIAPSAAPWLVALASPELSPAARERFETALGRGRPSALPRSIEEGRQAVAAFSGQGELYSGLEATESVLSRPRARPPSLIHLASHGLVDMLRPERSGLLLAGEAGRDGVLDIDEIVQLRLPGPVVVLASCSSSAGPVHRAEGTMSLARAFLHAGARSVVGNLHPVRDEESLAFFRVFYHHVSEGLPVGAALTQAKRDGIQRGRPAASWAGYVVHGDAAAVPLPARPVLAVSLIWVVGILCTAAGCWLALVVTRRRSTSRQR